MTRWLATLLLIAFPATAPAQDEVTSEVVSETMPAETAAPKTEKPVGIGVLLSTKPAERGVIARVVKGSPADKIGLEPGVRILAVNGTPVGAKSSEQITKLMAGEAGGEVKLKVHFPKLQAESTYTLKRMELPTPLEWTTDPPDEPLTRDPRRPDGDPMPESTKDVINRLRQ